MLCAVCSVQCAVCSPFTPIKWTVRFFFKVQREVDRKLLAPQAESVQSRERDREGAHAPVASFSSIRVALLAPFTRLSEFIIIIWFVLTIDVTSVCSSINSFVFRLSLLLISVRRCASFVVVAALVISCMYVCISCSLSMAARPASSR